MKKQECQNYEIVLEACHSECTEVDSKEVDGKTALNSFLLSYIFILNFTIKYIPLFIVLSYFL